MAAGEPGTRDREQWLEERAPEPYARWWDTPSVGARDQVALQIEKRLEELEAAESWERLAVRHQLETPRLTLADRVAGYEAEATRLGGIPLEDRRGRTWPVMPVGTRCASSSLPRPRRRRVIC